MWHVLSGGGKENAVNFTNSLSEGFEHKSIFSQVTRRNRVLHSYQKFFQMTKLMEWLLFATIFFGVWFSAITGNINLSVIREWHQVIIFLPLIAISLFGSYAVITVLYRVFTFNNCESAAVELQQQIEEAKEDLQSKGVNLKGKIS